MLMCLLHNGAPTARPASRVRSPAPTSVSTARHSFVGCRLVAQVIARAENGFRREADPFFVEARGGLCAEEAKFPMADASPEVSDGFTERPDRSPEVSDGFTERSDRTPEVSDGLTERSERLPEVVGRVHRADGTGYPKRRAGLSDAADGSVA